jgi:hypothetical protein
MIFVIYLTIFLSFWVGESFREKENTPASGVVHIWTICFSLLFSQLGLSLWPMIRHLLDTCTCIAFQHVTYRANVII